VPEAENTIFDHLGLRIRRAREALDLTQRELAKQLGVSEVTLQRYESGDGRIPPQRLVELAATLRVPATHFFEDFPGDAALKDNDGYVPVGKDAGARRLVEIYLRAPKSVKKQLLSYAEFLAKD